MVVAGLGKAPSAPADAVEGDPGALLPRADNRMAETTVMTHRRVTHSQRIRCMVRLFALSIALVCLADVSFSARAEGTEGGLARCTELIRERYPDGRLKIEREVVLDASGNYVNHGAWRMWDAEGGRVAEGHYEMGQPDGTWTAWYDRGDSPALKEHPFDDFTAPFTAHATFVRGQLDGEWTVVDASSRKCSSIALAGGKREGRATLWLPDGQVFRDATFHRGVPHGEVRERDADGNLTTIATYIDGHLLVNKTTFFPGTQTKQSEGPCFSAISVETRPDDFAALHFAEYQMHEEFQRHGIWKTWYSNGQLQSEGKYQFNRECGPFAWWHANDQKALEGSYVDGQPDGTWIWWYANGQKASQGEYHYGALAGCWREWNEDGRLARTKKFNLGETSPQAVQFAEKPKATNR
jgi:antitoxin component YwqK of YwqJK toxin-antitoxin module